MITEITEVKSAVNKIIDVFPPEMRSIKIEPTIVEVGDNISIYVEFSEKSSILYAYIRFISSENESYFNVYFRDFKYDETNQLWKATSTYKIPEYQPQGKYNLNFIITDLFYNTIGLTSPSIEMSYWEKKESLSSCIIQQEIPELNIINLSQDIQPPVIESISIDNPIISKLEDKVNIKVILNDDNSGVEYCGFSLEADPGGTVGFGAECSYNSEIKKYECIGTLTTNFLKRSNLWKLRRIELKDKAGNKLELDRKAPDANEDFWNSIPDIKIELQGEQENTPEIVTVEFSPSVLYAGEWLKAKIKIKKYDYDIDSTYIRVISPQKEDLVTFYLGKGKFYYNSEEDLWIGEKEAVIPSYSKSGIWIVDEITVFDTNYNIKEISRENEKSEDIKFLNLLPDITVRENPKEDTINPTILSLDFEQNEVNAGESVVAKMKVWDAGSGPQYGIIAIAPLEIEKYTSSSIIVEYLYNFKKTEVDTWEAEIKLQIKSSDRKGKWGLWGIEVWDFAGHGKSYNKDIMPVYLSSSTFSVK